MSNAMIILLLCMLFINNINSLLQQPNNYFYTKSKYLTPVQWKHINIILTNNSSSFELKQKIKNIIYNYHEEWAFSKVYYIQKKYHYLCQDIQLDELKLYAYIGLRKAIINYDSNTIYNFPNYASKYVYNEIFNGISKLLSIYLHYEEQQHMHKFHKSVKNNKKYNNKNKNKKYKNKKYNNKNKKYKI